MKFMIALAVLVAVAAAAPPHYSGSSKDAVILKFNSDVDVHNYNYAYETSDGIAAQEQGVLKNVGSENEALAVSGQFSYTGDDGQQYSITYIADENGFQPQGAHIPHP